MRFDLCPQLLQVLNDRTIDRPTKISVVVGDNPRLVSNGVIHILSTEKRNEKQDANKKKNAPATPPLPETDSPNERAPE